MFSVFGTDWIIDLQFDQSGTEIIGVATDPVEVLDGEMWKVLAKIVRWRIVDKKLVEEYIIGRNTFSIVSVPA